MLQRVDRHVASAGNGADDSVAECLDLRFLRVQCSVGFKNDQALLPGHALHVVRKGPRGA